MSGTTNVKQLASRNGATGSTLIDALDPERSGVTPNGSEKFYFTFNTGIVVEIQPVDDDLYFDLKRKYPAPTPPVEELPVPGGGTRWVENPYSKQYDSLMQVYYADLLNAYNQHCMFFGTVLELTPEQEAEVARTREKYAQMDLELDKLDKMVYLKKIAARGNASEIQRLIKAIQALSRPTEQEISEQQETFRR